MFTRTGVSVTLYVHGLYCCMFKMVEHNVTTGLYKANRSVAVHRYAPHNDVSVNDGSYIRIWSH